jgi:hypothetical protein
MARWLVLVAIAGCYSEPRPACGFVCGQGASCPGGYTCNAADNRCHVDGTSAQCDSYVDAAPDADTTPPTVVMMTTGSAVPRDGVVEVVFSEPVVNIDASSFQVTWHDEPLPGVLTLPQTTPFTARFTPAAPFEGGLTIFATLNATPMAPSLITDLAGNPLAPVGWFFSTAPDPTPLTVTMTNPSDGQTMVFIGTPVQVDFNKPIGSFQPTSIAVDQGVTSSVRQIGDFTLIWTPDPKLAAATTYTVTVATDILDTSGLSLAAPLSFSFTTM